MCAHRIVTQAVMGQEWEHMVDQVWVVQLVGGCLLRQFNLMLVGHKDCSAVSSGICTL